MSAETKFKNGDVITDGLVNGEIIGEGPAPHLTKPHMTRKGRGLTRRSDR